jgi:hypothetical protein
LAKDHPTNGTLTQSGFAASAIKRTDVFFIAVTLRASGPMSSTKPTIKRRDKTIHSQPSDYIQSRNN